MKSKSPGGNVTTLRRRPDLFACPWPMRQETDYAQQLQGLVRSWRNEVTPLLRRLLSRFADDEQDDTFDEIRASWAVAVAAFSAAALLALRRVSLRLASWWHGVVGRVTNMPPDVVAQFLREDWLGPELQRQSAQNVRHVLSIGNAAIDAMQTIVFNGMRDGLTASEIARLLAARFNLTEQAAAAAATNHIGSCVAALNQLRQQAAGLSEYVWLTMQDSKVRKAHAEREGVIFSWQLPPPDGHPGQPYNCRCTARPYFGPKLYGFPVHPRYIKMQEHFRRAA